MAIKNEILEDFFSKPTTNHLPHKIKNLITSEKRKHEKFSYRRFRVFDDPFIEEEKSRQALNKTEDKPRTNRGQIEDKSRTNQGQTKDNFNIEKTNRGQTGDRTGDKTEDKPRTNRGQTGDKLDIKCTFSSLVGLQRKITFLIYESSRISINGITQPISLQHIADCCKTTEISAKKTIQRLEKIGGILRVEFKVGRGGWTRYSLPENILQEIIRYETEDKLRTNRGQTEDKLGTELGTKPRTIYSSSSSSKLIKTTTTEEVDFKKNLDNLDGWKKLDFEPLSEIGFSQTHLFQIAKQNLLEPELVQESIYAFAFDLEKNAKAKSLKKSPIDFFMGILRNGSVYAPPFNYKSPKEMALEAFIEKQNHIQELEKKAVKLGFESWVSKISLDEKNSIVPQETKQTGMPALINQVLRTHFRENIWPSMQEDMLRKTN